ncbi:MAG TPA: hypothetical protein DD473_03620 [Planctomycetaceae bacterium]|nr:hypothetical protein [Planctomycetaceae bacterium]
MSKDRTPHWLIQLKFFLLCSPVGIVLAIVFAPVAIPVLLAFGGTILLFWHGARLFTNCFVMLLDPEEYESIKQSGGDPFYDCVGAPLNNDSEQVRITGHVPNAACPGCGQPVYIQASTPFCCPICDTHWHENNWWRWTGSEWIVLNN